MKSVTHLINWQLFRYLVSGGSAAIVNLGLLFALVNYFGVWYLLSAVVSYTTAIYVSFLMQKYFTFNDYTREKIRRQATLFVGVQAINVGVNALLMYVLVDYFAIHYLLAQLISGVIIAVYGFFVFKHLIFNNVIEVSISLRCVSCGTDKFVKWGEKDGYELLRCNSCLFVFVHPTPTGLSDIYNKNYFHPSEGEAIAYTNYEEDKASIRHAFQSYLEHFSLLTHGKKGNILDVGCATGYFLDMARDEGWKTYGMELSEYAGALARERGHEVSVGGLFELKTGERMDVVTMWDVLEHVDSPRMFLESVKEYMNPGAYVAINTPNIGSVWARVMGKKWHAILPPEHINYFNEENLKLLLEQIGFEIVHTKRIGKRFSLPYFFNIGYRWQGLSIWRKLANIFDTPFWRQFNVPVNLRDNVFVLARFKR